MTERFEADAVVIGAGVVGLAVAARLARQGREVTILEKNHAFGEETSSRNSEVIHAGLYYEADSLKGRFCVEGRDRLYAWCEERGVAHANIGKLIVATETAEEPALEKIMERAAGVGVRELYPISGAEARAREPVLNATQALWSPRTGVIDSHGLMLSLLGDAEDHGAMMAFGAPVIGGEQTAAGLRLRVGGAQPVDILARTVVNSAGFWAQAVAASIAGVPAQTIPPTVLTKGNYYRSSRKTPFSTLIYPAPVAGGLGVHVTLDLSGGARFGPDVEQLEITDPAQIDYSVDPTRAEAFYAAIRKYWPELPDGSLVPDYSGVRPKIDPNYYADFRVDGPTAHGVGGLINLFGIESPGLTGCLAIGDYVADLAAD
ncbi:MAG: NAD(P)/FAD-dependent oxidoreductase [Pseudomonadota bacterium]